MQLASNSKQTFPIKSNYQKRDYRFRMEGTLLLMKFNSVIMHKKAWNTTLTNVMHQDSRSKQENQFYSKGSEL